MVRDSVRQGEHGKKKFSPRLVHHPWDAGNAPPLHYEGTHCGVGLGESPVDKT